MENLKESKELENAAESIARQVPDACGGLPEPVFALVSTLTPMVNVDLLFRDAVGRILMTWREDICGKGWHIPGGICRFKETMAERLVRTGEKELNATIAFEAKPLAVNEIILRQKFRGHFISFLYRCYLPTDYPDIEVMGDEEESYPLGKAMWHNVSPKHWVTGQESIYRGLFIR